MEDLAEMIGEMNSGFLIGAEVVSIMLERFVEASFTKFSESFERSGVMLEAIYSVSKLLNINFFRG